MHLVVKFFRGLTLAAARHCNDDNREPFSQGRFFQTIHKAIGLDLVPDVFENFRQERDVFGPKASF